MTTVRRVLAALGRKPAGWLVLRPGDTLALRYEQPVSAAMAAEIRERVKRAAPGIGLVITAAAGMAVNVIPARTFDPASFDFTAHFADPSLKDRGD